MRAFNLSLELARTATTARYVRIDVGAVVEHVGKHGVDAREIDRRVLLHNLLGRGASIERGHDRLKRHARPRYADRSVRACAERGRSCLKGLHRRFLDDSDRTEAAPFQPSRLARNGMVSDAWATPTGIEPHRGTPKSPEKTALARAASERPNANGRESDQFAARSRSFVHTATAGELRAAIAAVTQALATAQDHEEVVELARERAALRQELQGLQDNATSELFEAPGANVLSLDVAARIA